ncbi:MAG: hypothetical protein MZW92_33010 [Comamonadaceae bacterium]|nr:hypothetical protein [Comamonadaceae bacterium]
MARQVVARIARWRTISISAPAISRPGMTPADEQRADRRRRPRRRRRSSAATAG